MKYVVMHMTLIIGELFTIAHVKSNPFNSRQAQREKAE